MSNENLNSSLEIEDIEDLDGSHVDKDLISEIASWKREGKAEDNDRYFWHVKEVDQIEKGVKYFVIGRKGSGKTALCEYFNKQNRYDLFAEKLSFKNFPFNELYAKKNQKYTAPNEFITVWKYLIYSTICRLMIKNEAVDLHIREQLSQLYDDSTSLSRRISRWSGNDFGVSLFGLSIKITRKEIKPQSWIDNVIYWRT